MRIVLAWLLALNFVARAHAQFDLLQSPTPSSLRGVSSAGAGIAWISGSEGAVFRTEDGGYLWQRCAIPPGGEHLDFRGIQGFDATTALVMSSGKGALSRVYKTTDGCASWKLVFENPDSPAGFWDALVFEAAHQRGSLWGDVVGDSYTLFVTADGGATWTRSESPGLRAISPGIGGFAASNSALLLPQLQFATSGPGGPFFYSIGTPAQSPVKLPMQGATASAGAFSLAASGEARVAVGGDYTKPEDSAGTAAWSSDGGLHWVAASTPPHGYRSAVAYDARHKAWLAVGPNGSDVSFDGGRTWRPLLGEDAKAWNAIALPFVVGPHGRIALVPDDVFKQ